MRDDVGGGCDGVAVDVVVVGVGVGVYGGGVVVGVGGVVGSCWCGWR